MFRVDKLGLDEDGTMNGVLGQNLESLEASTSLFGKET
jgi:hypothetical protein